MAWTPKTTKQDFPKGVATLAFNKKKTLMQVQFLSDQPEKSKQYAGRSYKVSEWPDFITKASTAHQWLVKLGKDKLYFARPWKGYFSGKFAGFYAKEGEKPAPSLPKWEDAELQFTAYIEVVDGLKGTAGATYPYYLRYRFVEDEDGNVSFPPFDPARNTHTPKLIEFTHKAGAWVSDKPLKMSDNILPALQKRMLKADKVLIFQVKNGEIVSGTLDNEGYDNLEDSDAALWDADDDEAPF